jgi:hypothetical protein
MGDGKYSEQRDTPLRGVVRRFQKSLTALALRVRELESHAGAQELRGPLGRVQAAIVSLAARMSKVEARMTRAEAREDLAAPTAPPPADAPGPYAQEVRQTGNYDLQERLSASQKRLASYDKNPPQQTQPMAKGRPADPDSEPKVFAKPSSDSKKTLVGPRKKAEGDE